MIAFQEGGIPLGQILEWGVAGVVIVVVVIFLKFLSRILDDHKEQTERRDKSYQTFMERLGGECHAHQERISKQTTETLSAMREQNTREHDAIIGAVRDLRAPHPPSQ